MERQTRSQRIAYRYLYGFRRTVPPLAAVLSLLAWLSDWQALAAGLLCIAIGELLETSYYLSVLRWAERSSTARPPSTGHMHVFLETDRLILRRFTRDDLDDLCALNADPDVPFYINGVDRCHVLQRAPW